MLVAFAGEQARVLLAQGAATPGEATGAEEAAGEAAAEGAATGEGGPGTEVGAHEEAIEIPYGSYYSPLPALIVFLPLLAAVFVRLIGRTSESLRNAFVVVISGLTLIGTVALIPLVGEHHRIACEVPLMLGRLDFTVDSFSMFFAIFSAFVWFASTLYSLDYLHHEKKHDRYHITNLVVLSAMLGVVLAGDLVTLYLFFEALGLVAFLFVIHTETPEAKKAAIKYFWMTVMGGFALIGGIMLTYALGGTGAIGPIPTGEAPEALRWAAAGLLVLGFGVKAGMQPVHVWLPDAHPVAPSPASALLSGVMIKAGAYGIFRTVTAIFRPEVGAEIESTLWHFSSQLGLVVLWIGIFTMFTGVCMALLQSNAKRMLAYHSVSQMGFILAGIGAAGYLAGHGAMGYAGGLFHIVNHALFKACLFLGVGAVFFRTGSLDMYRLGGLWKKMPLTFLFTLIAAAGITGIPLFNGFVSKCLIHHSIVEAMELHGLASLAVAEKIYIITCGGTACSFIKLIGFVFLGKPRVEYGPEVKDAPVKMLTGMGILAAAIIVLGWFPQILINGVFAPGLHTWGLHTAILQEFLDVMFLSWADVSSVIVAFAIGFTVFFVGIKTGLFHAKFPNWVSIDWWYRQTAKTALGAFRLTDVGYEAARLSLSRGLMALKSGYRTAWFRLERNRRRMLVTMTTGAPGPRVQHLIQHAYVLLERERQAEVRYAIQREIERLRITNEHDELLWRGEVDAVREIAAYIAQRLFNVRMGVITEAVRAGHTDEIGVSIDRLVAQLAPTREDIEHVTHELAPARMAGSNVLRDISAAINRIVGAERFDLIVLNALPRSAHVPTGAFDASVSFKRALSERAALTAFRAQGLTGLEKTGRWVTDMMRIVVDSVTRERASWVFESALDEASVVATRRTIQRYARDMSFNIAVIVLMLLAFVYSLSNNL
ncbi:MAG: complex I subunit 5 family protein [Coriobacteriia bacterium]